MDDSRLAGCGKGPMGRYIGGRGCRPCRKGQAVRMQQPGLPGKSFQRLFVLPGQALHTLVIKFIG